jgi:hypothetical protein
MSRKAYVAAYSDTEILNRIEDFLANHFAIDERHNIPSCAALEMLEHIEHLLDLRTLHSQQLPNEAPESSHRAIRSHERS